MREVKLNSLLSPFNNYVWLQGVGTYVVLCVPYWIKNSGVRNVVGEKCLFQNFVVEECFHRALDF